jgi:hypothetical protein
LPTQGMIRRRFGVRGAPQTGWPAMRIGDKTMRWINPCSIILTALLAVNVWSVQPETEREKRAVLKISVVDAKSGEPLYARCLVNAEQGRDGCSVEGRKPFRVGNNYCYVLPETLLFEIPPGETTVELNRGLEYEPIADVFPAEPGECIEKRYVMKRWADMASRGWYSGEVHIHHPEEAMRDQILAEDLNVGTCLADHIAGADEKTDSPEIDHVRRVDDSHFYSVNDQEIERFPISKYAGPCYLVNLKKQIHLDAPTPSYPLNIEYQRRAREQGAVVCLHSASFWDAPVSAALGTVDAIGLACNFFSHDYTAVRVEHYGNADDLELYGHTPEGTLAMALGKYYRLLNCGFRLAASAGTAAGLKPNPVGHNRAYVHIDGPLTTQKYWDGFKAGRSFVTNGPMAFFEVEGREPGADIHLDSPKAVAARLEVQWNRPIQKVEIVFNGEPIAAWAFPEPTLAHTDELDLEIPNSGWLAARVMGEGIENGSSIRFAHTSPIYITIPGHPADPRADAAYYVKWLRHQIEWNSQDDGFEREEHRREVETQLKQALAVYERLARGGRNAAQN